MQIKVASVKHISVRTRRSAGFTQKSAVIHKAAPDADEAISYGMPAFNTG